MRRSISMVLLSLGSLALVGQAVAEDEEMVKLEAKAAAGKQSDAQAAENEAVRTGKKDKKKDKGLTVTAENGLNLRDKPTIKDSKILAVLPKGTKVKVLDKSKHPWWRASAKGKTGYLWHGYLKHGNGKAAGKGKDGKNGSGKSGKGSGGGGSPGASSGGGGGGAPAGGRAGNPSDGGTVDTRNLSGLNPDFRAKVERILKRLKSLGWQPRVAEGRRTVAQQREKVRKGYSKTMNSRHLTGNAADIIDSRYAWNIPTSHQFWNDLGAAAAAEGLTWGGNWKSFKDVAHVQQ